MISYLTTLGTFGTQPLQLSSNTIPFLPQLSAIIWHFLTSAVLVQACRCKCCKKLPWTRSPLPSWTVRWNPQWQGWIQASGQVLPPKKFYTIKPHETWQPMYFLITKVTYKKYIFGCRVATTYARLGWLRQEQKIVESGSASTSCQDNLTRWAIIIFGLIIMRLNWCGSPIPCKFELQFGGFWMLVFVSLFQEGRLVAGDKATKKFQVVVVEGCC